MIGQHPGDLYRHKTRENTSEDPNLHNPERPDTAPQHGHYDVSAENTEAANTAVPSTETSSTTQADGTWGEREVGGPVSPKEAMQEFEVMRRELSHLSHTRSRSHKRSGSDHPGMFRSLTGKSGKSGRTDRATSVGRSTTHGDDVEAGDASKGLDFDLAPFMKEGHFEKRTNEGHSAKKVGVVYKSLTVKGVGSTAVYAKALPEAILGTFGPDLYKLVCRFIPALNFNKRPPLRTLINDFTGVVRDGEMMFVLGRPGSGCTSFLKAIANKRDEFASVTGDVSYGGISAAEQLKHYRGEVTYNPEDDQHLPNLNVWQTLKFSLLNKTKKREKGEISIILTALLKMFGITHTAKTLVGDQMVRGISGGERKRVSIAETLAAKSTVVCWDNSTRGLDASTALDYANSLRIMTDVSDRTTLVTLYQAGEQIYELMDKVLVIDEGRMLFQGSASEAKQYFIDLGLYCPERETTADFLTSITLPSQRQYREGFEKSAPRTPEEFERAFKNSEHYQRVLRDVAEYEQHLEETGHGDANQFKQSVQEQRSKYVSKRSNYTVSYWQQVLACTQRELWLLWGDKTTLYTKFFIIISNGLIVSSLFYGQKADTSGAFTRGGLAFFSILFLGWLQLSELIKAVSGRVIIQRHKEYAFYRPSAVCLARVIADLPMIFAMNIPFSLIMYFLGQLDVNVSKFWIYFLFVFITTLNLTAVYRMFASLSPTIDDAVRFAGTAFNILVIFTGYVIAKPQLIGEKIWFGWLYYINPFTYAFEAVLTNEFDGRVMPCAPEQLVPQGPGIDPQYQGCAITGAQAGTPTVTGPRYLESSFGYTRSHLWRNLGVVIAFTVLYILVTLAAAEIFSFVGGGGGALVFKRGAKKPDSITAASVDEEKAGDAGDSSASKTSSNEYAEKGEEQIQKIAQEEYTFTWTDVHYSVPYEGGERKLLEHVDGYAKPGIMTALMGVSGAGKTTLLNTLSQRQYAGKVEGNFLIDGRPLGVEFQRVTGYVEQMDLHDRTATIREAIEFSAILRQDHTTPKAEKLAYVDEIIDLLELREIQDVLILSLGVEQRKRVTIAVELAAKPSILFLDEPTTGLDSQSAYTVIHFLQKLARAGHGIICTIHQPSSILVQKFDMILALNPGGQTIYFGPVGENGAAVNKYFADREVYCPPHKNIAEFILETAAKGGKRKDNKRLNWTDEWRNSAESKARRAEIDALIEERSKVPHKSSGDELSFAAPLWLQCTMLTKRMFTQHWREPSYLYGKIFVAVIVGIINGFTFWSLGNTLADMQNRMFSSFLIIIIPPTVVNSVLPKFFQNMALWQFRENPSRIYGWFAFCTASVVTEIPISIITATIYWLLWYWPTGLPRDSSTAGYTYFMTMLFFLFQASWGQWICAFAPSFAVISNVLPFFFVMFSLFNGVIRPWSQLPVFWKYSMYYVNPSTYWIGGVLAAVMPGTPVQCAEKESARFNPPPGQSCVQWAGEFVLKAGQGYLTNPDATSNCGYCPYKDGTEYIATLNIKPDYKWKYLPIFLAFCISNWALVYFFIYTVRVKHWSFGLGYIFGPLGTAANAIEKGIGKIFAPIFRKREEKEGISKL